MAHSLFYRRRFLNRRGHHGGAYVLAQVEVDRSPSTEAPDVYATLTVSDCRRSTQLDFGVFLDRDAANALHKARQLQEVLRDFTAALETAIEERAATD